METAKVGEEDKSSSSPRAIARVIDQTFLKKGAVEEEIKKIAQQTKEYGFRGFCVFPEHTKIAKEILSGSVVKVTTLIDEPTGNSSHQERMEFIEEARDNGSDEIDVVMQIDKFKNGEYDEVLSDLREICKILPTKVIIGSGYLTDGEIKKASEIVKEAGAICVKTATVSDPLDHSELSEKAKHVRIMKESATRAVAKGEKEDLSSLPPGLLVKAAGSIRSVADLKMMVEAGADIIGTSSGVEIVDESNGVEEKGSNDDRIVE